MIYSIQVLWDNIPIDVKEILPYNLSTYNVLNKVTEWIFTDTVPGFIAQHVSTIIENLYKNKTRNDSI